MPGNWKNFSMWRGRLPHWRADGVTYYVTFRHRRPLEPDERRLLLREILKPDGRDWELSVVCVLPEQTELIGSLVDASSGKKGDPLSNLVERAKTRAGKAILKRTDERFPPFYAESYDRIIRDEVERDTFVEQILTRPAELALTEYPEGYDTLWVK